MNDQRNFVQKFANEGGGDVFVEDVKLAERTSQSSVASTDYILMEDTDGAFHKILKSSFNEAVRGAFGDMLANLDKGTSISALAALGSTGNDLGSITPANLASVLGVNNPLVKWTYYGVRTGAEGDLNNFKTHGYCGVDQGVPNSIGTYGTCFFIKGIANDGIQLIIPYYQHKLYCRICNYADSWSSWTKLLDFDNE